MVNLLYALEEKEEVVKQLEWTTILLLSECKDQSILWPRIAHTFCQQRSYCSFRRLLPINTHPDLLKLLLHHSLMVSGPRGFSIPLVSVKKRESGNMRLEHCIVDVMMWQISASCRIIIIICSCRIIIIICSCRIIIIICSCRIIIICSCRIIIIWIEIE